MRHRRSSVLCPPETAVMLSGTPGNVTVFAAAQWGTEQVCQYIATYQLRRPMTQKEWRRLHVVLSR